MTLFYLWRLRTEALQQGLDKIQNLLTIQQNNQYPKTAITTNKNTESKQKTKTNLLFYITYLFDTDVDISTVFTIPIISFCGEFCLAESPKTDVSIFGLPCALYMRTSLSDPSSNVSSPCLLRSVRLLLRLLFISYCEGYVCLLLEYSR